MNEGLERMWKELVVVCSKVLSCKGVEKIGENFRIVGVPA
jgi:hypothetical protein